MVWIRVNTRHYAVINAYTPRQQKFRSKTTKIKRDIPSSSSTLTGKRFVVDIWGKILRQRVRGMYQESNIRGRTGRLGRALRARRTGHGRSRHNRHTADHKQQKWRL